MPIALVALLATGCSPAEEPDTQQPRHEPRAKKKQQQQAPRSPRPQPDVAQALASTLRERAAAIRSADRTAFLARVAQGDPDFVADQTTYLDNLDQLPLARFDLTLEPSSLARTRRGYWAIVSVTTQLEGYDARPVVTPDRYLFTPQGRGRYAVASVTDQAWETENDLDPPPWELGPITVRTGTGVLGIFDAGSTATSARVVSEVQAGASAVAAEIPYEWNEGVVVYALDDSTFLSGLDNVPGSDPLSLDAVSFEVLARPDSRKVASTRFVLNPDVLDGDGPGLGRLIRHELTHVALGQRADGVPTWLSEGLAEYVSVRPMAPEDRAVSGAALAAAEAGLTGLPTESDFGGPESEAGYGIAWWACEYLASTYTESILWSLLEDMRDRPSADVLRDLISMDEQQLARRTGDLMLDTYRPEPRDRPTRSPSSRKSR
ncbi:MAG TPA: hypothetical protein VFY58_04990 [Nocardioides sp.]|nr:hypothetical protein [Nocardioides sp.]